MPCCRSISYFIAATCVSLKYWCVKRICAYANDLSKKTLMPFRYMLRESKALRFFKNARVPPSVLLSPIHLTVAMYHRSYESAKKKRRRKKKKKKEKEKIIKTWNNWYCYIPRLSLNKTGTAIGWFLLTWPWLKSTVSRSWYIKQRTPLRIHYSTWSKHVGKGLDRRRKKHWRVLPVFFFVTEHNNTNMKPQAKTQRFSKLSQRNNGS